MAFVSFIPPQEGKRIVRKLENLLYVESGVGKRVEGAVDYLLYTAAAQNMTVDPVLRAEVNGIVLSVGKKENVSGEKNVS